MCTRVFVYRCVHVIMYMCLRVHDMYMCRCVCRIVCACTWMCVGMYAQLAAHVYTMHMNIYVSVHVWACVGLCMCAHAHVYAWVSVCVQVCICVYAHRYRGTWARVHVTAGWLEGMCSSTCLVPQGCVQVKQATTHMSSICVTSAEGQQWVIACACQAGHEGGLPCVGQGLWSYLWQVTGPAFPCSSAQNCPSHSVFYV